MPGFCDQKNTNSPAATATAIIAIRPSRRVICRLCSRSNHCPAFSVFSDSLESDRAMRFYPYSGMFITS